MGKANWDISKQMHNDLIEAYKKVYHTCWSQSQAYELTVRQPAPRFYVTARQASQVIAPMLRGEREHVDQMYPMRRQMYYDLFAVVQRLIEKREFIGRSLHYIMKFAVLEPAPRFYISARLMSMIRGFMRNGVYDENGKVRDDRLPSYVNTRVNKRKRIEERKQWMLAKMSEREAAAKQ